MTSGETELCQNILPGAWRNSRAVGWDETGDWLLLDDGGWVFASAVVVKGDVEALPVVSASAAKGQ